MIPESAGGPLKPATPPPEMVERLIEVQARELQVKTREIEIRAQDIELQKQKDQNQYQFALASLQAQREDRDSERAHIRRMTKGGMLLVGVCLALIAGTLACCVLTGNAPIALEILKGIGYMVAGGFGGWGIGKRGKKKEPDEEEK